MGFLRDSSWEGKGGKAEMGIKVAGKLEKRAKKQGVDGDVY